LDIINDTDFEEQEVVKTTRDPARLRERLLRWFTHRFGADAAPEVSEVTSPSGSGMSSETLLFDASWSDRGSRERASLVARLAPDARDVPIFPSYDMEMQFRLIELVAAHSDVPVPGTRWLEPDPSHLGSPFFVMNRVQGRVPTDNPPYLVTGWMKELDANQRVSFRDHTVGAIASLHAIDVEKLDTDFLEFDLPGDTHLRRHFENQKRYYAWIEREVPIVERSFEWLERNWPQQEGPAVISWGDARIGNVMYRQDGVEPVALLDWEMAGLAPRGADLGWLIFFHAFWEDLVAPSGVETLPDLFPAQRVAETYERLSGQAVSDLDWYRAYAGLRHAIIMARIVARMVSFGQAEFPEDPSDAVPHRPFLEKVVADDDTWRVG